MSSVNQCLEPASHPCTPLVIDVAISGAQDLLGCSDLLGALDHVDVDDDRRQWLCFAHLTHRDGELERFGTGGQVQPVKIADTATGLHMDDDAVGLRHFRHWLASVLAAVLGCALVVESVCLCVDRQLHCEGKRSEK